MRLLLTKLRRFVAGLDPTCLMTWGLTGLGLLLFWCVLGYIAFHAIHSAYRSMSEGARATINATSGACLVAAFVAAVLELNRDMLAQQWPEQWQHRRYRIAQWCRRLWPTHRHQNDDWRRHHPKNRR